MPWLIRQPTVKRNNMVPKLCAKYHSSIINPLHTLQAQVTHEEAELYESLLLNPPHLSRSLKVHLKTSKVYKAL